MDVGEKPTEVSAVPSLCLLYFNWAVLKYGGIIFPLSAWFGPRHVWRSAAVLMLLRESEQAASRVGSLLLEFST